jgi:hypothetical protein
MRTVAMQQESGQADRDPPGHRGCQVITVLVPAIASLLARGPHAVAKQMLPAK